MHLLSGLQILPSKSLQGYFSRPGYLRADSLSCPVSRMIAMQQDDDDLILHDDEIDDVLASLQALAKKVSSPTVRVCLQDAHDDIAHLASRKVESVQEDEHVDVA
jgi:hypothetical protein